MRKQLKSEQIIKGNPIGEMLGAYQDHRGDNIEDLESKLDEIILRNVPKLEKGISLIKLIASVAPLLGLLGTVVGMIATFQAITLFGTGDPKLMAGVSPRPWSPPCRVWSSPCPCCSSTPSCRPRAVV
jgi:biopolymer transport protein ExbB